MPPTADFMGLGFAIAFSGLAFYGIYLYARSAKAADTVWLCLGAFLTSSLLFGVFAPPLKTIRIPLPGDVDIQLWHLAGIGITVWVIVTMLFAQQGLSRSRR